MPIADLQLPPRLLAGGGPSTPDPRVLGALTTPVIGQFDPEFTVIMDDVVKLARKTLLTNNRRCFPISALASAGVEAVINTLLEVEAEIAIGGDADFVANTANIARRLGARVVPLGDLSSRTSLLVVPLIDPARATLLPIRDIAQKCHGQGIKVLVEATLGLGACELRVDDWTIDICVAGVDYAVGAPSGMTLVTYSAEIESMLEARQGPPGTSYLDLLQLQAYWSPDRLNHHTAPTSLIYGLREALRLVHEEGLEPRWTRHARCGQALRDGLLSLGLEVGGDLPFSIVHLPPSVDESETRGRLLDEFGIHVKRIDAHAWRLGLLGADARAENVHRLLISLEKVLTS